VEATETTEPDAALWFSCDLVPGSHDYLIGNAHTFRGRLLAYCERKQGSPHYYVSASVVLRECSDAARWWVKGFLAGSEPDPPRGEDGDYLPSEHPRMVAWRRMAADWAESGIWPEDE